MLRVFETISKPILILDLDGTSFIDKAAIGTLELERHIVGDFFELASTLSRPKSEVAFINPEKLRDLVEKTCTFYGGIFFMTAGFWDEDSVKEAFITQLKLSANASEKILNAPYLNTNLAKKYFPNKSLQQIQEIKKSLWLEAFLQENFSFRIKKFVALDDNPNQIHSFLEIHKVRPILATTHPGQTTGHRHQFYKLVLEALNQSTQKISSFLIGKPHELDNDTQAETQKQRKALKRSGQETCNSVLKKHFFMGSHTNLPLSENEFDKDLHLIKSSLNGALA